MKDQVQYGQYHRHRKHNGKKVIGDGVRICAILGKVFFSLLLANRLARQKRQGYFHVVEGWDPDLVILTNVVVTATKQSGDGA